MLKAKEVDVLGGPLLRSIIEYSIPVMLGCLIQVLFNAADIVVIGHMADTTAVASVGATSVIAGLPINLFVGLSGGTSILLSRYVGALDKKNIHKTVDTSIICSCIMGIVISLAIIPLVPSFLRMTDCPEECFKGAEVYLMIYFAGIPAIMVYNFGAAIIRVTGDSQRPLHYMIISGILNVVLNVILCLFLTEKVAAVAFATVSSQILGAVLVVQRLVKINGDCHINFRSLNVDLRTFIKIIRFGAPCALTSSLYSLSNLQIQSAINSYGQDAIAGNTAAGSVEGLVASFTSAFGSATLAFTGQNVGAGNVERVKKTTLICLLLGTSFGLVLGVGLFLIGDKVLALYIPGEVNAIAYGLIRMRYVLAFYAVASVNNVLISSMQAFGCSAFPMINSLLTVLGFRVIWMLFVYPLNVTIENLYVCYTYSWLLTMLAHLVTFAFIFSRFLKGKVMKV